MALIEPPDDLRRFILTSIPSVPYLEAVLLLRGEPDASWTAQSLAKRLYLPKRDVAELLKALVAAGVASNEPSTDVYTYAPEPAQAAMLDGLAQLYAVNLRGVTELIHSRVGRHAYQFADAFRWRKGS
jgi:DNA-binding IclR family transcriptional regulator